MHVTDFERLDWQRMFQEMMDLIADDSMWVDWIKSSRLCFGPWRIEEYKPFRDKYGEYVNDYNVDVVSFNARVRSWL